MNRTSYAMIGSLVAIIGIVVLLLNSERRPKLHGGLSSKKEASSPLLVYCAASNRNAMEAIRVDYEREFDCTIQIQYGASQTLLSSMEVSGTGDLFLPADDSFLKLALDKGLIAEAIPVAQMKGVLAVRKGNPKAIRQFDDLHRNDVRLVQANPDAAAIGKVTRETLLKSGKWDSLDKVTVGYRTTVNDAAGDVVVGAADVAIVYDAVIHGNMELESVSIKEFDEIVSNIVIGVLAKSEQPQLALHFARYVTARDRGLNRYRENGFGVSEGDIWSEVPEITLYAGSMLRPAIDRTIAEFEEREGVRVHRVYNGCGILVAQMKSGTHPDAYFACDTEFMRAMPELFPDPVDVSSNELAILVKKGNPHDIASLRDLTKPNLRVGIGHEKQCAMGWLTQNTLRESGIQKEVMSNVTVQTPSGDMLVNQLQAGSLDAAIAYLTNAAGKGDFVDAIQIEGIPCAIATQPFAIANDSKQAQIVQRLFNRLSSKESKETFIAEGFGWKAKEASLGGKGKHD